MSENQKKIWITGASTGIGKAVAEKFSKEGWKVAISARREELLKNIAQDNNIFDYPLDVTDEKKVVEVFKKILEDFKNIDLCIFGAGTYEPKLEKEISQEQIRKTMEVNFFGVVNCIKAVEEYFKNIKNGHISIVSSIAGYRGLPNSSGYGPSKAALSNLAESLYFDFKKYNVRVSVISPGFIKTPLTDKNDFPMPFLRSVEFASKYSVPLRVLHAHNAGTGTLIKKEENKMEGALISGIAFTKDEAEIMIKGVKDQPGVAGKILGPIGDAKIEVDMIVQNASASEGATDMTFTVPQADLGRSLEILEGCKGMPYNFRPLLNSERDMPSFDDPARFRNSTQHRIKPLGPDFKRCPMTRRRASLPSSTVMCGSTLSLTMSDARRFPSPSFPRTSSSDFPPVCILASAVQRPMT